MKNLFGLERLNGRSAKLLATFGLMLFLLGACKPKDTSPAATIIGKWKWTAINNKGLNSTDFADFKSFQQVLSSEIFEFKSDNTYTITHYDGSDYSIKGNVLTLDGSVGTFTVTATTLTFEDTDDKVEMIFTRQ